MARLLSQRRSAPSAPSRGASRRRLVSLLGAVLLLAFAPRLASAEHEHLEPGSTSECAACLVGHTPALEAAPVVVVPVAPVVVDLAVADEPVTVLRGMFAYAVPFACGPPA